jgi:hypothetical protein
VTAFIRNRFGVVFTGGGFHSSCIAQGQVPIDRELRFPSFILAHGLIHPFGLVAQAWQRQESELVFTFAAATIVANTERPSLSRLNHSCG